MLNEVAEYEQYTYSLDTYQSVHRLRHKTICDKLQGMPRAMTIIARKLLFDERDIVIERPESDSKKAEAI